MANGKHAQAAADSFVYLEARHVDALTDATQAQTRQLVALADLIRKQTQAIRDLNESVNRLADLLVVPMTPATDVSPGGRPIADRRKAR